MLSINERLVKGALCVEYVEYNTPYTIKNSTYYVEGLCRVFSMADHHVNNKSKNLNLVTSNKIESK